MIYNLLVTVIIRYQNEIIHEERQNLRSHTDKETKIKQVKYKMENLRVKRLTEGKFTVLHVVPVHHCDMRTSPVTPPTGAP